MKRHHIRWDQIYQSREVPIRRPGLADVGGNDMWQHSYVFNDSADNVESLAKGKKSGNFIVFRPSDQILKINVRFGPSP